MKSWPQALKNGMLTGSIASVCSATVLALCGKIESGSAAGPNNGPSQWIWGEGAAYDRRATWRHTAMGYAIHHATSVFWATLHEKLLRSQNQMESNGSLVAKGAATAALACFVDYKVTPRRLQPGFDKQLSRVSLFFVYAAFGLGLALGAQVNRRCAA
jgi:hypothetical protein